MTAQDKSRRFVLPLILGSVLLGIDVVGVMVKAQSSTLDAATLAWVVPGCVLLVLLICGAGLAVITRSRIARIDALVRMFPDAIIQNVSDQPGAQLYRFRSLCRDRALVTRRYLKRPDVSIVVVDDSIQGWVGGRRPRRAFLLPKANITSLSVDQAPATPIQTRPVMKVALKFDGVVGDVYFMFGGGKKKNSWSLMSEEQTEQIVRRCREALGLS